MNVLQRKANNFACIWKMVGSEVFFLPNWGAEGRAGEYCAYCGDFSPRDRLRCQKKLTSFVIHCWMVD